MRGTPTHRQAALAATVLLASQLLASPASAHERWFVKDAPGGDWGFFFSPLPVTLAAVMVVVTVVWRWVGTRVGSPELPVLRPLGRLAPFVPRLLAIHIGVNLLALAATGDFLAHSLELDQPRSDPQSLTGWATASISAVKAAFAAMPARLTAIPK